MHLLRVLPAVAACVFCFALLPGQSWQRLTPERLPVLRHRAMAACSPIPGTVVMFGGAVDASTLLDDTWLCNGATWKLSTDHVAPPPRHSGAMAYDAERRVVVLHGGLGAGATPLDDTWEWDGTSWTERGGRHGPGRRAFHAMAYDEARSVVVLHGGRGDGPLDVTWEWDGGTWYAIATEHTPGIRSDLCMAWVGKSESILLHGGTEGGRSDSWLYDGTDWSRHESAGPPVLGAAMAAEPRTGRVLLVGGRTPTGGLEAAWIFDPELGWLRSCAPAPAPRMRPVLAAGGESGILLFGGGDDRATCRADLWEWTRTEPGALALGRGCGVAGRLAELQTLPDTALRAGGVLDLQVTSEGGDVDSVQILLGDGRFVRRIALPIAGDQACHMWCPIERLWAVVPATLRGGDEARLELALPADSSIHGLELVAQAVCVASTAPAEPVLSNGLLVRFGAR